MYLSALLKGRALDVYSMMPTEYANDYDQLKDALLKRYQLSADGFKKRFRSAKPEAGETPIQFLTRLDNYLLRWIELAKADKSFEGLKTLIVQEQYLSTGHIRNQCPRRSPDPKPPSPPRPQRMPCHHRGHRRVRDNNGRTSSRSQR